MPIEALNPLANPIPAEYPIQLARHLGNMSTNLGYNFDMAGAVNTIPTDQQNTELAQTKACVINVKPDIDRCLDLDPRSRTNYLTSYRSTCMLDCYMWNRENSVLTRGLLHADLHKYIYSDEHWTLYNENEERVVREVWFDAVNIDNDFEQLPIIKIKVMLAIYWAALRSNLAYPR